MKILDKLGLTCLDRSSNLSGMDKHVSIPKWELIDKTAAQIGVGEGARRKWRERGHVPYRWRLPIIQAAAGEITALDFPMPNTPRAHGAAA